MEKANVSAIVKFYNYFMKSPEFKKLERIDQFSEPFISATFSVLTGTLIFVIYSLIMILKGLSPFDNKHVALSIILFISSTSFVGFITSIYCFWSSFTKIGTYEDLTTLKTELEQVIQKIIFSQTLSDREPSRYIDTKSFSIEIDRITSLLYSTSMKVFEFSFYNRLSEVLTKISGESMILSSCLLSYDDLRQCVEKIIFFDIDILNAVPISRIHKNDLAEFNSIRCLKDYGSIIRKSDLLKNKCYDFLIKKRFASNPKDLECLKATDLFDKNDFMFNCGTIRLSYGLTCSEMDKRIAKFRKDSEKGKEKNSITWI